MAEIPARLHAAVARLREAPRARPGKIEPVVAGEESVWDFPRPPRIETVPEIVRVEHVGIVVAESDRAVRVCETAGAPCYYVPPEHIHSVVLAPSASPSTLCEWKGEARYWNLEIGDARVADAAWSYPEPFAPFEGLADFVAFFASRLDGCFIGDERATPQPGGFYGGWVTHRLRGPLKGEPGSEGW